MKSLILLALVAAVSAISSFDLLREEWNTFKLEHNKKYDSETEEKYRMKVYSDNKLIVAKHNQRYQLGLVSYRLKTNKYSDMPHHEFMNAMNGFNHTHRDNKGLYSEGHEMQAATFISPANVVAPSRMDWRRIGAVTAVKDQNLCGACWSFSATGALEGQHFRKTGFLVSLSEQNLIDCTVAYGNRGCKGGWMDYAFRYIKNNRGIDTETKYPYEAVENKCRYNPYNSGAYDVGLVDIPAGREDILLMAVATVGPIAVAIDASDESFKQYSHGVYYKKNCSTNYPCHAVLVVGYGTDKNWGDYWLVKNSWGSTWGERGYIRMARNRNNNCGIASRASYPLV